MLQPLAMYRFKIDFVPATGMSEEYQMFLTRQVAKAKINYVKKQLEIWFIIPEEGPIHELTEWFIHNPITLMLHEFLPGGGEACRILRFKHCKIVDNEIVYDYSSSEMVRNYTVWSYEQTDSD